MAGRENADLILEKIKKEDSRKGRLKIFFGYAAGDRRGIYVEFGIQGQPV